MPGLSSRSLICQMPFQVMAFLPFLNARYCGVLVDVAGGL